MVEPLCQLVLENLNSLIQNEIGLIWNFKTEFMNLSSMFTTVRDVLEDAEDRGVKDKVVRNWLAKLKEVTYEVDDVLDECAAEPLSGFTWKGSICINQVRKPFMFLSCFKRVIFRHNMGRRIEEINARLEALAGERSKFHFREEGLKKALDSEEMIPTDSLVTESQIYGRDEDKRNIVELLLNVASNQEHLLVIPIVGMGGLGKTTLTQLAYNDVSVMHHFSLRLWVSVSQDFGLTRLVKAIIESTGEKAHQPNEFDPLQNCLRELIRGKRFLLVLDDVWNEYQEKWERLKQIIACGGKGSSVIVTTQSERVATIMSTLPEYYTLTGLSVDDCWSLFRRRALGDGRIEERPKLVAIGKEIVKKCGGLPLAAKALGSLMRFKSVDREWETIRDSEIWDLPEDENGVAILPALMLSYRQLSSLLKQCFVYCSVFPKGYEIEKEKLIRLWVANGFVPYTRRVELEDTGNEVFNGLVWRSFFQDLKKDADGNIIKCKMHDLVHDLARSLVGDECFNLTDDFTENIPRKARHFFWNPGSSSTIAGRLCEAKYLRTLLFENRLNINKVPDAIFKLKYLRVLDLTHSSITELPPSIGALKHLRYLNLLGSSIEALPTSICNLRRLQTLNLRHCNKLQKFPQGMRHMSSLRHLDVIGCQSLTSMPSRIGQLSCLQTLPIFLVGKNDGDKISELSDLKLGGELHVRHLERVRHAADAKDAKFQNKQNLRSLVLSWEYFGDMGMQQNNEEVLEGLKPHINLEGLQVNNFGGAKFPEWMQSLFLQNLSTLSLLNCKRCENLPPLGLLPSLKSLYLKGMDALKLIDGDFYGNGVSKGFPSLEELWLEEMLNLEEWQVVGGREVFPCLHKVTIYKCPKLRTLPFLPLLSSLDILYLNELTSFPEGLLCNVGPVKSLDIGRCPKLQRLPGDIENLVSLKSLKIWYCEDLLTLPDGLKNLTCLERLELRGCRSLTTLPEEGLRGLVSLQRLTIYNCQKLTSLPSQLHGLAMLQHLAIKMCPNFHCLPEGISHLSALQVLEILDLGMLASLPDGLQHLSELQRLEIASCPCLVALPNWIGSLTSLQYLSLQSCNSLTSLPEGMQHLTNLQNLTIRRCPELARRCKEGGDDWHKVAHIPFISIQ
ncbi:disease resistance protein RGA2-like [Aristolochia californica]|uniref:disease resistance protein RGA2-like n=1 Tax=Aristolochia californica TaxID=171875 RepID=UPI0035DE401A